MWHGSKHQKSYWMDLAVSSEETAIEVSETDSVFRQNRSLNFEVVHAQTQSGSGIRQSLTRRIANYPGALWIRFIYLLRREDILERSECKSDEMRSFGRRECRELPASFLRLFCVTPKQVPSLQRKEDRHLHNHVQPSGNVSPKHFNGPPAP